PRGASAGGSGRSWSTRRRGAGGGISCSTPPRRRGGGGRVRGRLWPKGGGGGGGGTGEFPPHTTRRRGFDVGETWFPPRERAAGERRSLLRERPLERGEDQCGRGCARVLVPDAALTEIRGAALGRLHGLCCEHPLLARRPRCA